MQLRIIVNLALAERITKGIKVKQPLSMLKVKRSKCKIKGDNNLLGLIKDEVNVREVVFDEKISNEVELDTNITEQLRKDGLLRELIRFLQGMRKDLGLKPINKILIFVYGQSPLNKLFQDNKEFILQESKGENIYIDSNQDIKPAMEKEVLIGDQPILLGIKEI